MNTKKLMRLLPFLSIVIMVSCAKKVEEVKEDTKVKVYTTIAKMESVDRTSSYTANVKLMLLIRLLPRCPDASKKYMWKSAAG